jgi:hypothetical protein
MYSNGVEIAFLRIVLYRIFLNYNSSYVDSSKYKIWTVHKLKNFYFLHCTRTVYKRKIIVVIK